MDNDELEDMLRTLANGIVSRARRERPSLNLPNGTYIIADDADHDVRHDAVDGVVTITIEAEID